MFQAANVACATITIRSNTPNSEQRHLEQLADKAKIVALQSLQYEVKH
jgi:hypothetical protein